MKKKLLVVNLILCLILVAPLLSACSLFDIDTDKLYEQLQNDFDYDGVYVVEEYYENLSRVQIANQPECLKFYEIKGNSTLNVIEGEQTVETFQLEGCVCGNIDFSDRKDISGKFDADGRLTITQIFEDKTTRLVCARSVGVPTKLLGTYSFFSFRRGEETIFEQPTNANYIEENSYFEKSQLSFVIGENNNITTLLNGVEQENEKFFFTDSNIIATSTQRFSYSDGILSVETHPSSNLDICFNYKLVQ